MITPQTLTDSFPELAAKTPGQLQSAIDDAYAQSDPSVWASTAQYNMYVKYLAAHLVSIFGAGGSGSSQSEVTTGAISKRRVGNVEVTYSEGGSSTRTSTSQNAGAASEESYFEIAERLLNNNADARFPDFG